jgi:hypothetical protein
MLIGEKKLSAPASMKKFNQNTLHIFLLLSLWKNKTEMLIHVYIKLSTITIK